MPSTLPTKLRPVLSMQLGRLLDPDVSLALLLAEREERDARAPYTDHVLGEDRTHVRVLGQVLRRGVGVGADVEQQERRVTTRDLDREGRALDPRQRAQDQHARRHARAGVPGGDDRVRLAVADQLGRDHDRAALLAHQRPGRVLVHPDELWGMDRAHVARPLPEQRGHQRLVANEDHLVVRVRPRVGERPGHHLRGAMVAADGVHGDAHAGMARDGRHRIRHGGQPVATGSRRPQCHRPA